MDRARNFEFVAQFPRRTVEEVELRDAVYDKQVLLNESWQTYCIRVGYSADRQPEEHVKWVTETWAEYEQRVIVRGQMLDAYFSKQQDLQNSIDKKTQERQQVSKNCVAHLVGLSNAAAAKRHQPIHTLYVDFEERQEKKMQQERFNVEETELAERKQILDSEAGDRKNLDLLFAADFEAVLAALERRRHEKEEEERRIAEEQRRKAEELRRQEEQKKKDAEAAEKARREAEEEAKRAERKRREEERKNKAKAEREARAKQNKEQDASAEQTASDALSATAATVPSSALSEEPASPTKEAAPAPVEDVQPKKAVSKFRPIDEQAKAAVHTLFAQASSILRGEYGDDVYIARVSKGTAGKAYVVSHNGSTLLVRVDGLPSHLVGCTLARPESLSVASPKLHKTHQFTNAADAFAQNRCEYVPNVKEHDTCFLYRPQGEAPEKAEESLLLVPIDHPRLRSSAPYVIGLTRAGINAFSQEEILGIVEFVLEQITPVFTRITEKQAIIELAQQALDWLSVTTTCKNCYLALSDNPADPQVLEYVASSVAQKFVIGKKHTRADEAAGVGISFTLLDDARKLGQPIVAHVANVADKATNKINSNKLLMLGDPAAAGPLLLCPVLKPSASGGGVVFGVIYADAVGTTGAKEFTKGDEDIVRTTAALLAELMDVGPDGAQDSAGLRLSIEKELLGDDECTESPIRFLKHVWLRVNTDISKITSGQLLELAKYHHPPPIIPVTITATMLVALGCQPKSVEQWEDSRKKIKTSLLEKIIAFDPTDSHRRKKAYFTRARKITKNYSAHDVFVRGSYPASCFFTWTFVTILLRRSADALRKSMKALAAEHQGFSIPLEFLARGGNDDGDGDDDTSATGTIDPEDQQDVLGDDDTGPEPAEAD